MLPDRVGDFRAQPSGQSPAAAFEGIDLEALRGFEISETEPPVAASLYVSASGERLAVSLIRAKSDAAAYSLLTQAARQMRAASSAQELSPRDDVGTAAFSSPGRLAFFKGNTFVGISSRSGKAVNPARLAEFARLFAETLDAGGKEIPVLVKHLPDWEKARERAEYAVSQRGLKGVVRDQPVLDAVNFEAGVEAVAASYDPAQLLIVEYGTPQLAATNDARINARLKELQAQGAPAPTAYRKVGNYSVFVFNAPDEQAAARLIDQVKYEQNVQWLGENPLLWQRAAKKHTRSAINLIVSILKASGVSILIGLGTGGLIGALVFIHRRRAQKAMPDGFSDAGGMLRLNLDEMTPRTDPARLLGSGER